MLGWRPYCLENAAPCPCVQHPFLLCISCNGKQFHAKSNPPIKSLLTSLNAGVWVRSRPQSALSLHYANRPVVSAPGRAISLPEQLPEQSRNSIPVFPE